MTAVTFDTLKFVETLRAAGVSEAQAKVIAQAFKDAQGEVDVATKADLRDFEHRMRAAIPALRGEIIKWVAGLLAGSSSTCRDSGEASVTIPSKPTIGKRSKIAVFGPPPRVGGGPSGDHYRRGRYRIRNGDA